MLLLKKKKKQKERKKLEENFLVFFAFYFDSKLQLVTCKKIGHSHFIRIMKDNTYKSIKMCK